MTEKPTSRNPAGLPRTLTGRKLMDMFNLLFARFGAQDWWPAKTDLEMMVGAVLTQNTNWKNVERAIENLKSKDLLSINALCSMTMETLAQEIRPAGYYNVKAKRLMRLIQFLNDRYGEDLSGFYKAETQVLREGLLSVNGVGPETADSILLYAARRPVFVIDAYTHRILKRHGMSEDHATYDELQELFMDHLPEDQGLYSEFHALLVHAGKNYCKKKPLCLECPLEKWETG